MKLGPSADNLETALRSLKSKGIKVILISAFAESLKLGGNSKKSVTRLYFDNFCRIFLFMISS